MNQYKVFYTAEKKSSEILIEAENERAAKQKAKAQLISRLGPTVEIGEAIFDGPITDK